MTHWIDVTALDHTERHLISPDGRERTEPFSITQVQDGDVATFSPELVAMGLPPRAILKRVT